jgi:hypothetical protein
MSVARFALIPAARSFLIDFTIAALVLLTLAYPVGLVYDPDYHGEACEVYEGLVESGHAIRIRSDDFEGVAYQLSPEMAEAHRRVIASRADQAGQN